MHSINSTASVTAFGSAFGTRGTRIVAPALLALVALAGCASPVNVDAAADPCADDALCIPCTFDTDCPNDGVCNAGVCGAPLDPGAGPTGDGDGGCANTSECAMDQMCNGATRVCEDLPSGWCRQAGDCTGGATQCSAASSNVPGVCVECLDDGDCSASERCGAGGSCVGNTDSCPPNSTRNGNQCVCNAGFHLDTATHTCETDAPTAGCVDNAHPIPGQAGRCECDVGFVSSDDGNACVRPDAGGGNNGGGNTGGGNTGGGSGGDTGGDDGGILGNCGPNTIAIFFVCFCLPGFEPNPAGDIGCSEDADGGGDTGTGTPDTSDDGDTGTGSGDVCEDNGWYSDDVCDTFCANPDPDCDDPEATTPGETAGDVCAENGWYGDDICDDFCPTADPDCDTTGTAGDDVCETNGWYDDDVCDTFCPNPDPDCAAASDVCAENGWYGDDICDDFCANPDPDCSTGGTGGTGGTGDDDVCAENGWYDDGVCDTFCANPDPDCTGGGGSSDICEENGWYSDMICDTDCASPDPDCSDVCVENEWYGDGVCDTFCDLADPDC